MPAFQLMAEAVEEKKKFQRRSYLGSVQWLFELMQTTMSEYTHSKIFLPSPPPSGKVIFMHLAHGLFNFFWRQPDLQHQEHKRRNGRKRRSSPPWLERTPGPLTVTLWENASLVTALEGFTGERM